MKLPLKSNGSTYILFQSTKLLKAQQIGLQKRNTQMDM